MHGPVPLGNHRPFSSETEQAIGAWSDGRLDISDPAVYAHFPTLADAILARDYGWESVRGPGPMTWRERATSLQLAAEERHGAPVRARVLAAVAQEDAAAQQSREAAE